MCSCSHAPNLLALAECGVPAIFDRVVRPDAPRLSRNINTPPRLACRASVWRFEPTGSPTVGVPPAECGPRQASRDSYSQMDRGGCTICQRKAIKSSFVTGHANVLTLTAPDIACPTDLPSQEPPPTTTVSAQQIGRAAQASACLPNSQTCTARDTDFPPPLSNCSCACSWRN